MATATYRVPPHSTESPGPVGFRPTSRPVPTVTALPRLRPGRQRCVGLRAEGRRSAPTPRCVGPMEGRAVARTIGWAGGSRSCGCAPSRETHPHCCSALPCRSSQPSVSRSRGGEHGEPVAHTCPKPRPRQPQQARRPGPLAYDIALERCFPPIAVETRRRGVTSRGARMTHVRPVRAGPSTAAVPRVRRGVTWGRAMRSVATSRKRRASSRPLPERGCVSEGVPRLGPLRRNGRGARHLAGTPVPPPEHGRTPGR